MRKLRKQNQEARREQKEKLKELQEKQRWIVKPEGLKKELIEKKEQRIFPRAGTALGIK